ncbi:LTA synthase family protein [Paenibacillus doosanensis]|uniref:LTA synthase family protein n=1 Tax=Paenibacillus doosanensis TaxID=1229154 RepID=UPI00217FEACB|nr:LTA synthase family protein [Paenibacillus doosanensis]MCS7459104.1 LTA synthase family protein [Paenibacillus doosanensis]
MKLQRKARHKRRTAPIERNRALKYGLIVIMLAVVPLLLVFGVEFIQRGSFPETWAWMMQNQKLFAVNAIIDLCVLVFFYSLFGSMMTGVTLASLLLSIMALVCYFKTKLIGEPFFPWDIFLKKEGMNIIPLVTGPAAIKRLAALGLLVVVLVALHFVWPRLKMHIGGRAVLGILALVALYSLGVRTTWAAHLFDRAGVSEIVWDQKQNYSNNGMALAFTMNVKNSIISKPEGYSEPAMASLAQDLASDNMVQTASVSKQGDPFQGKQPNVIFIMNEAFWDPTLLPNVQYSEDPVPTIHKLQKESTSGYLLSPQFGGGTSNVEYEVLTGQSMSFLPDGSVPYQQYISKPVPSLASYFETQGYKSMGIHSYEGWFWNRESVYKELGFESFMSKDQFENPEYKGLFISDDEVSRNIIKQVDETDRPMFIYAVTMQNHGPYDDNRYGETEIKANGNLTDDARSILETYTQGAHDADQSLKMLIDHFQQSDEPTVIVFYGDHLPMLGLDYDVYKQGGLIGTGSWSLEETKKMHSVPFVMWSNVDLPQEQKPTLSDSFLGTYVLNKLGMEKPASLALNDKLLQEAPGLLRNLVVDADGGLHQSVPEDIQATVNQYRDLQYDQLFGKQYLAKYIDQEYLTKQALPNYNEEFAIPAAEGSGSGTGGKSS